MDHRQRRHKVLKCIPAGQGFPPESDSPEIAICKKLVKFSSAYPQCLTGFADGECKALHLYSPVLE
jgi:hypothetical protein